MDPNPPPERTGPTGRASAASDGAPLDRRTPRLVLGLSLLVLAGVLCAIEYFAVKHARPVWEAALGPGHRTAQLESPPLTIGAEELSATIRIYAPLDNAWLTIGMTALDAAGQTVAQGDLSLSYYRWKESGLVRVTGNRLQSHELIFPAAGTYRLRFTIKGAEGSSSAPSAQPPGTPIQLRLLPNRPIVSFLRVAGFMVFAAVGAAVTLRAFLPPDRGSRPAATRLRPASGERLVFLDGLRGLACAGVVLCHFVTPTISLIETRLREVLPASVAATLRHGELGVEIFFVLSGFVIAYSLRTFRITAGLMIRFAVRRALRLDPPYHIALMLAVGVAALKFTETFYELSPYYQGTAGFLANAFYLQDILRYGAPISVAWTLCLEIQFYLAYVVLAGLAQGIGAWLQERAAPVAARAPWLPALLVFGPLAAWSVQSWYPRLADFSFAGTWFRFFLGVLVFHAVQARAARGLLVGAIGLLLTLSFVTRDARGAVAAVTAALILIGALRGRLTAWLSGAGWQYLGRISYSLYLAHIVLGIPLVNWLWGHTPHSAASALVLFGVGLAGCVGLAHLFHVLYEQPSLALSRRIQYPK